MCINHFQFKTLFSLFLGITASGLSATNYYVNSVTGNDSNNGLTTATAKKTLSWFSWSTDFLKPGDTVFVMNGTYTGGTNYTILALRASGSAEKPLVITNYPGHSPLLQMNDNQWHAIHLGEAIHHIVIDGLRIRGNASTISLNDALQQPKSCADPSGSPLPKYNGNGITIDGRTNDALVHHVTVRNCEIFECCGGGVVSLQGDYLTYENNIIYNNSWYTIYGSSGISNLNSVNYDNHSEAGYTMIIRNNIVYGNELYVPWIGPCKIYDGNGIIIDSETNSTIGKPAYTGRTLIENNVVHHNGGRGIHMYHSNGIDVINNTCFQNDRSPAISDGEITIQEATNVKVFNNIMYARTGERANYKDAASTGFSWGNNLIYNATGSLISFTNSSDVVGKDPQFMDTALYSGDFQLKNTSPAIDAGSNVTGQYTPKDINGVTRDNKPDIGAYEKSVITEIGTIEHNSTFTLYPNPANNYVMLKGINTDSQIEIYDNLGRKVAGQIANANNFKIDISGFNPGVYFLKLINEGNTFQTGKLIKE